MLWQGAGVARIALSGRYGGLHAHSRGYLVLEPRGKPEGLYVEVGSMIPDEFSMPRPPVRRAKKDDVLRGLRPIVSECRLWLVRLGVLGVLVVVGLVCMKIIDSTGLRTRVLADIAGVPSGRSDARSLLKGPHDVSPQSQHSVAVCEKLVSLKPGDAHARVRLGDAYASVGRTPEALVRYQEALALDPHCFDAHLGIGKVHFNRGSYSEAATAYRQALKIRPGSADAHVSLGLALSNAGQCEEAMQAFQKAKELDPAVVEVQVLTGQAYLQAGMCAQAIECLNNAVRADQEHARAYFNLGRAYLRVGDIGLAMEQQHILQNLDPRLADQLLALINP